MEAVGEEHGHCESHRQHLQGERRRRQGCTVASRAWETGSRGPRQGHPSQGVGHGHGGRRGRRPRGHRKRAEHSGQHVRLGLGGPRILELGQGRGRRLRRTQQTGPRGFWLMQQHACRQKGSSQSCTVGTVQWELYSGNTTVGVVLCGAGVPEGTHREDRLDEGVHEVPLVVPQRPTEAPPEVIGPRGLARQLPE